MTTWQTDNIWNDIAQIKTDKTICRDVGKDAIRILLLWKDEQFKKELIVQSKNVNRSVGKGGVAKDVMAIFILKVSGDFSIHSGNNFVQSDA